MPGYRCGGYPHRGRWSEASTVRRAHELNEPVFAHVGGKDGRPDYSFAQIDNPNVILDTVKLAEEGNGAILRFYEANGSRGGAAVMLGDTISALSECNLVETGDIPASFDGTTFRFAIQPYEIKTFRVSLEG